jgi:hypothetical protein
LIASNIVKPSVGNGAAAFPDTFNLHVVALFEATITFGLIVQFLSKEVIETVPLDAVPMSKSIRVLEPGATEEMLDQTPDSGTVVAEKNEPVGSVTEKRRNLRKSRTVVW